MTESRRHTCVATVAWTMSFVSHFALLATLGPRLARGRTHHVPAPMAVVESSERLVDVVVDEPARQLPERARVDSKPVFGGDRMPRPDERVVGRGGDDSVSLPAVNLAPRDDAAHLIPAIRSRLERSQTARKRTSNKRTSPEDDRVSRTPMMLTFVAVGPGVRAEQRPWSRTDPNGGAWRAAHAARIGRLAARWLRDHARGESTVRPSKGEQAQGPHADGGKASAIHPSTGPGLIRRAAGSDSRVAANVKTGAPEALEGRPSAPSNKRGSPRDNTDAEQEVMPKRRSLLRASTAGGNKGSGRGGEAGPGATGANGTRGPGSRATPLGAGEGHGTAVDPGDRRRRTYLRQVWTKIHNSWSAKDFPLSAALAGKQAYTIVSFTIGAGGTVSGVVVTRPSRTPAFDAKMLAAVRRAAPFGPMPADLGRSLRHSHGFVLTNPVVR